MCMNVRGIQDGCPFWHEGKRVTWDGCLIWCVWDTYDGMTLLRTPNVLWIPIKSYNSHFLGFASRRNNVEISGLAYWAVYLAIVVLTFYFAFDLDLFDSVQIEIKNIVFELFM